jgi:CheY-like chemotaxis protein
VKKSTGGGPTAALAFPKMPATHPTAMSTRKKILLVDDDAGVVAYLAAKLSRRYEVVCTVQPRVAVPMARAERPDVILCDIDMPGMSGGEVTAALAAQPDTALIPVIYLTALVTPAEARALHGEVSGRPALSKRATMGELFEKIDAACAPRAAPQAGWSLT